MSEFAFFVRIFIFIHHLTYHVKFHMTYQNKETGRMSVEEKEELFSRLVQEKMKEFADKELFYQAFGFYCGRDKQTPQRWVRSSSVPKSHRLGEKVWAFLGYALRPNGDVVKMTEEEKRRADDKASRQWITLGADVRISTAKSRDSMLSLSDELEGMLLASGAGEKTEAINEAVQEAVQCVMDSQENLKALQGLLTQALDDIKATITKEEEIIYRLMNAIRQDY